jgi:hypothetical protein
LPAVFSIAVLGDGTLLVAGSHGWDDGEKHRRNLGRLYHLAADGSRIGAWPASGPADATLLSPVVSGTSALVGVSRSADGPPPADLPIGGVAEVDLTTMQTVWTAAPPVLTPWFRSNFIWDALGLGADFAFAGFGDGRAFLYDRTGKTLAALTPGVPIQTGGVPIAAGVGFGTVLGDTAWFLTTATNIPWGSADPMARPPSAHPAEYTVHAVARDGTPRWTKQLPQATEGIVLSPDGATLLVGGGSRSADQRTDLFGAVLLDAHDGRVVTTCASEGPVDFRPAWAPDAGAFAVTEAPFLAGSDVRGRYQVTVFR